MSGTERRRVAVRVTPDALRQLRGGHPWVYDAAITSVSHDGEAGDLAVVFDSSRRFAAIGLWDPHSPIRVKVLHAGRPRTIDRAWFADRIRDAAARRAAVAADGTTTGYRVVHGENDGLPALVVDRYDTSLVVKIYSAAWFSHLDDVLAALLDELTPDRVVLRLARNVAPHAPAGSADGTTVHGPAPTAPQLFTENGLVFEADLVHGQKTGQFLDQRENRARVGTLAGGAAVLDVFSGTGGFSVHAASGGAGEVHLVDLAAPALATARRNLGHNAHLPAVAACRATTTAGDGFDVMADLARRGRRYGVVVVDPPSFAAKQADVKPALRAYARLTRLAVALVERGGVLVQASCSSRVTDEAFFTTVVEAAARARADLHEITRTGHGADHPVGFPQGAYLKALFARVE